MKRTFSTLFFLCLAVCTAFSQVEILTAKGVLRLYPIDDNAVRVQVSNNSGMQLPEYVYTENGKAAKFKKTETAEAITMQLRQMGVVFDKKTQTLKFLNSSGESVLQEIGCELNGTAASARFHSPEDECLFGTGQFQDGVLNVRGLTRRLTQVNTQISVPMILSNKGYALLWNNYGLVDFNPARNSVALTAVEGDGVTQIVDATSTEGNKKEKRNINAFETELSIPEDGAYSLLLDVGQKMARKHKLSVDGKVIIDANNIWLPPTTSTILSLSKGKHKIVVEGERHDKPVLFWRKVVDETEFSSPFADGIDYTVFTGSADEAIAAYRRATGGTPMMPQWALGYIHCRERYTSSNDILENAAEFKKRNIPLDVIVQDWQWWGKYGWNAMRFDEDHYPDPKLLVDSLHKQDVRLMLSVWSKIDRNSELGKEAAAKGYYIPETDWIDFFNPKAADFYWSNFSERLLKPYGIDAWWQDATEPENDDLLGRKIDDGTMAGEWMRNIYPLFVNRTVYEGLRRDAPEKRAMILTRCGFPGIQRYGAATWSGDVGNDWETLRRQIVGGLGQMAAGLPWWTYDAGGFFRPGDQYTNKEYQERFLRWLEAGTFLPLMRVHGYMSQTEPWRYGEEVENISRKYIELRKRLTHYIYSNAARVSMDGYTLMRPLVMDFPNDREALKQDCEYMFGDALLVAPVVKAGARSWRVYLPEEGPSTKAKGTVTGDTRAAAQNGSKAQSGGPSTKAKGTGTGEKGTTTEWIDFWTGKRYSGGQYVEVDAPIDRIPLFVKAGSIIPMTDGIHVYTGKDAEFVLYQDDGTSYNYEKGEYTTTRLQWNDKKRKLSVKTLKSYQDKSNKQNPNNPYYEKTPDLTNIVYH